MRAWRRVDRIDELEQESVRRDSRYLQTYIDEDGMVVLRARLEPEAGAAVLEALEAASKKLYEKVPEGSNAGGSAVGDAMPTESTEQRQADAMGLVAESALANGLGTSPRADRYQVVVHVDAEALEDPRQAGVSMLEEGQNVSAETSRRPRVSVGPWC